jgi:hypothetical protein
MRNHEGRVICKRAVTGRTSPAQKKSLYSTNHPTHYYKQVAMSNCVAAEKEFVVTLITATGTLAQAASHSVAKNIFFVGLDSAHNGRVRDFILLSRLPL